MAQLCLYVEDDLMAQIKEEAHRENVSLSKYVRNVLGSNASVRSKWPESFWNTFGAISDETFEAPQELSWEDDAARLALG